MSLSDLKDWYILITQYEPDSYSKFIDLAPNDNADEAKNYFGALTYATNNRKVFNIALTGPYGSGKSSIIKTFLKRYKGRPFEISLAAFLPEADGSVGGDPENGGGEKGSVSKQEIERSILQQMLYGADANSLPLSRFKRIQSPKWGSWFISLVITFGLFACWYLFQKRSEILNGVFFSPFNHTNWFNLTSFTIGTLFLWLLLRQIYVKSFGVSLKSISLKDIEITPEVANEESILNRHLDEIIYFFQSTKYDLVVIEDLDRFNNPDIFVTLREINRLVNENAGVKRHIRFLYALRDDMFANTDRTKFFEFVIPVIPIINTSNSIDKVIERGKRLSLNDRLDSQFLRDVSRYLNDMRLIQNIFNEYAVYDENLAAEGDNNLDPNKLLAILIYKNVLPRDFEELHREKGSFAEILKRHEALIATAERSCKAQISALEQQINDAERQVPGDLDELRKIYAMALLVKIPQNCIAIDFKGNSISIPALPNHPQFEELIEEHQIQWRSAQGQSRNIIIGGFQKELGSSKSYQERKAEIEGRSRDFKAESTKKLRELRLRIPTLRTSKFNEIIRVNAEATEKLFDAFGEYRELVRFLVFEGFLDDTYYQYTSLFHAGRLSPNDNKYLIQIRGYNNPPPEFQIDNPEEVIAAMRGDDFRQEFVLNTILVDCMFGNQVVYGPQVAKLISFISSSFDACEDFFSTYYANGKCISELMSALIDKWPGFVAAALSSSNSVTHVARMIAHLPEKQLETLDQGNPEISEFISENLSDIMALGIDFEPSRLALLHFETKDLASIKPYPAIARVLSDKGLYEISIENLEFIFRDVLGSKAVGDLQTRHYSTVLSSGEAAVIDKVEADFDVYLESVLLELEDNSKEDVSTIIKVISRDEIGLQHLERFVEKQSEKLPELDEIPTRLHSAVFRLRKIEATWGNCAAYRASDDFDPAVLTAFLVHDETLSTLSSTTLDRDEANKPLCSFLFKNNDFEDDTYRGYIRTLPWRYAQFPVDVTSEKLRILIEEGKVTFSNASFSFLAEHEALQVLFVARNIEAYFVNSGQYELDDDFREQLLTSDISDEQKLKIIDEMDLTQIPDLPSRAFVIGRVIHHTGANLSHVTAESAQAIINNAKPLATRLSLFNKYQEMLDDEQVRNTIDRLPHPFSEIKRGWGRPTIPNTPESRELVSWLEGRSFISSSKLAILGDKIRINNRRK